MAGAMRAISIERGYDPRHFVLPVYGGAGALHVGRLAELLEVPTVIIPRYSGVLSTLGLLYSDIKNDYVRTMLQHRNAFDLTALNLAFHDREGQAHAWLTGEGIAPAAQRLGRFADLRYANQGYELAVPVPDGLLTETTLAQTLTTFHQEHQRLYTYASPELPVALVNLRIAAHGPGRPFALQPLPATPETSMSLCVTRPVYFSTTDGFVECPVHDYVSLPPGTYLPGPAIITQDLSTIVVQPQHQVCLDSYGNIITELLQS